MAKKVICDSCGITSDDCQIDSMHIPKLSHPVNATSDVDTIDVCMHCREEIIKAIRGVF